jgi:hypothetical protein|tara:strand:- start:555 stop:1154 length:600 start_codon:yes stop_codon:yes gene_type:complete
MGFARGPRIITEGLVLALDAASQRSYPGTGTTWYDLSGNNNDFTLDGSGITWNSSGYFSLADGGMTNNNNLTDSTTCTFVFWMRTTDIQALFWQGATTSTYLGAFRSTNKFYNNVFGSPTFHTNTVERANIYDFIRTDEWMMMEFKSVNMDQIDVNKFNEYGSFTFGSGAISMIHVYNKNLTIEESTQNYNAQKSRFNL